MPIRLDFLKNLALTALLLVGNVTSCVAAQAGCPLMLDDSSIRIQTPDDVALTRQRLYQLIWAQDTLPTDAAVTVTKDVSSIFACNVNIAQVDRFNLTMHSLQNDVSGWAWHFTPVNPNHRLVIVHTGHMLPCGVYGDAEDGLTPYGFQMAVNALLRDGYDVLFVLMPLFVEDQCLADHSLLFQPEYAPRGGGPIRYFLDMTLNSVNYLLQRQSFSDISMFGLSGGGWSTMMYAALDPRVMNSFPIAGSIPMYLRQASADRPARIADSGQNGDDLCGGDVGDIEQYTPEIYNIAGYLDLYVLASFGEGRQQVQIFNRRDDCCFGVSESGNPATYDLDLREYERRVRNTLHALGSGSFTLEVDEASTVHQMSRNAIHNLIMAELNASRPRVGSDSSARLYERGYNGHLWGHAGVGWQDLGLPIVGVPQVRENAPYSVTIAARGTINDPRLIFLDNGAWTSVMLPTSSGTTVLPDGKLITDPQIVSNQPIQSDIVGQGSDFNFYHWHVTAQGISFEKIGESPYAVGEPAIGVRASGALTASFRTSKKIDPDSGCLEQPRVLYSMVQTAPGGYWNAAERLGATTSAFPVSIFFSSAMHTYTNALGPLYQYSSEDGDSDDGVLSELPLGVGYAGSPSQGLNGGSGTDFYMRTVESDLAYIKYNHEWSAVTLNLNPRDSATPQSVVDSPRSVPGGVYWTGHDQAVRFYDGNLINVRDAVDTIFRDDDDHDALGN